MQSLNLKKFQDAVSKLTNYVTTSDESWERKHNRIFCDSTFVMSDLVKYGLVPVTHVPISSNRKEVEALVKICEDKLKYLTQINK